jgi:hypothetical protein
MKASACESLIPNESQVEVAAQGVPQKLPAQGKRKISRQPQNLAGKDRLMPRRNFFAF